MVVPLMQVFFPPFCLSQELQLESVATVVHLHITHNMKIIFYVAAQTKELEQPAVEEQQAPQPAGFGKKVSPETPNGDGAPMCVLFTITNVLFICRSGCDLGVCQGLGCKHVAHTRCSAA